MEDEMERFCYSLRNRKTGIVIQLGAGAEVAPEVAAQHGLDENWNQDWEFECRKEPA
jgi:hypothetical protein